MTPLRSSKGGSDIEGGHRRTALRFVLLLGVVSLFADMTYEAARSITGPYLAVLGASATLVGIIAGLGKFIGYGLRIVSGVISDRTHRYWLITVAGYAIQNPWTKKVVLRGLVRRQKGF